MVKITKNVLMYITVVIAAIGIFACSKQKLRLPIEEVKRPLSLPPKNWGIGLAIGPGYYQKDTTSYFFLSDHFYFAFPYLSISDRAELHFPVLCLKYYLIRNTKVIDSTLVSTGSNWTIGGGINRISISGTDGISSTFIIFSEYNHPIKNKIWISPAFRLNYTPKDTENNGFEQIEYKHHFDLLGSIDFGLQWTRKLYSKLIFWGRYYHLQFSIIHDFPYPYPDHIYNGIADANIGGVDLHNGYTISKRWKLYVTPNFYFTSHRAFSTAVIVGINYYW